MTDKITSIEGLAKWVSDRIQLIEDVAVGQRRQPFRDEYDEIGVLKLVLEKIDELEASVRERMQALMKEVKKGTAIQYELFVEARAECNELRRILGGGKEADAG